MQPTENPYVTNKSQPASFIDTAALMRIKSLELRAKVVVEGLLNGLNRSPYHGFSVEFSEYREYTPGDDLRYLDWKLFARSDRYYVKRFEDETNLRCQLLLDTSRSMNYGSLGYSKFDYARTLAATLAYFLSTQRDAVGLITFSESIDELIPARFCNGHFHRLLRALERAPAGSKTNLAAPLEEIARRKTRRGMLVLISDLLAPIDNLETNLGYLRTRGQEVILFHILDPAELSFDFQKPVLFEDAESGREVYVDPHTARSAYLRKLDEHISIIRTACNGRGIEYRQFLTDAPLETALSDFLRARLQHAGCTSGRKMRPTRSSV